MLVLSAGYIAGFVDPEVSNRSDLFDVYVNLPDSVITVSQSAKGTVCSKRKLFVSTSALSAFPSVWCSISHHRGLGHGEVTQGHRPPYRPVCRGCWEVRQSGHQGEKHVCTPSTLWEILSRLSNLTSTFFIHRTFLSRPKRSSPTWCRWLMSVKTLKSHWKV